MRLTRREFNRLSALASMSFLGELPKLAKKKRSAVAIVKTSNRKLGISQAAGLLGEMSFAGKDVYLKGSFNSSDPYPATTHPDSLRAAVELLRMKNAQGITLIERSGMGDTRAVLEKLNFPEIIRESGLSLRPLEDLRPDEWRHVDLPKSHWEKGIEVPSFLNQDSCVVQVCNLKTHRFGGQFSASLKNSVGLIAKYDSKSSRNYMKELHASAFQCQMISEVNQVYSPALIIMDAVQVFIEGGPETGELANPEIIAASRDRVALDAVGIAILQYFGAGVPLNRGNIFDQDQIKRAVELKLGAESAGEIELVADDEESLRMAAKLERLLKNSEQLTVDSK